MKPVTEMPSAEVDRFIAPQMVGQQFRIFFNRSDRPGYYRWHANYMCHCGKSFEALVANVASGKTKSCGCLSSRKRIGQQSITHGASKTRVYRIWLGMIRRCSDIKHNRYADYGGRGISVCDRWLESFSNFLIDMGHPPSDKHSLDRYPNNDGNYQPDNCRWATASQQARNTRFTKRITANGESLQLVEWSERLGIDKRIIDCRLRRGWSEHDAINVPVVLTGRRK